LAAALRNIDRKSGGRPFFHCKDAEKPQLFRTSIFRPLFAGSDAINHICPMPRYVAFLRGINLGNRRIPMSELRSVFENIGFDQVETFIASGNVIFSSRKSPATIERTLEKHLEEAFGFPVDTFLRGAKEVIALNDKPPFLKKIQPTGANAGEGILHVGFFKSPLQPELADRLNNIRTDVDRIFVTGREYFWRSELGVSQSKIWKLPEVRALNLPSSTMRNITSIRKLIAKHLV